MKKQVSIVLLLLVTFAWTVAPVTAVSIGSDPETIDEVVSQGQCKVIPFTVIPSDDTPLDISFRVSERLLPAISVMRLDDTHFALALNPSEEYLGRTLEGLVYVEARAREASLIAPFSTATLPVQVNLHVQERQDIFESACPVVGEQVEVVPLSLDALSLLLFVLIALGVVNVSARMRVKRAERQVKPSVPRQSKSVPAKAGRRA